MFLGRADFEESIEMMEFYSDISTEKDINFSMLERYAREFFEDFDSMIDDNKKQIIDMIKEDLSIVVQNIN